MWLCIACAACTTVCRCPVCTCWPLQIAASSCTRIHRCTCTSELHTADRDPTWFSVQHCVTLQCNSANSLQDHQHTQPLSTGNAADSVLVAVYRMQQRANLLPQQTAPAANAALSQDLLHQLQLGQSARHNAAAYAPSPQPGLHAYHQSAAHLQPPPRLPPQYGGQLPYSHLQASLTDPCTREIRSLHARKHIMYNVTSQQPETCIYCDILCLA